VAGIEERRGKINRGFWWKRVRKKRTLGRPRGIWEEILKQNVNKHDCGGGGMDWIDVVQDTDGWQALINLRVPQIRGIS